MTDVSKVSADGGLDLDIRVARSGFALELALAVPAGSVTAIVGPNGAGKSTTLRVAAGLTRPSRGTVVLDGRVLDRRGAEAATSDIHVPPADRGLGVVFQDYLLFPHLSAAENIAFGLVARGARRADAAADARAWLERWQLGSIADRRPAALSGGQAQRVALARALIVAPPLLLLDEPLAALDASTRLEIRAELATRLRAFGGTTLLVTHDPADALAVADELVVLDSGRLVQRGTPSQVAAAPANAYVAGLLGLNRIDDGAPIVFAPAAARLGRERPDDDALAVSERCTVVGAEEFGGRIRVVLATVRGERVIAELTAAEYAEIRPAPGVDLWLAVAERHIR